MRFLNSPTEIKTGDNILVMKHNGMLDCGLSCYFNVKEVSCTQRPKSQGHNLLWQISAKKCLQFVSHSAENNNDFRIVTNVSWPHLYFGGEPLFSFATPDEMESFALCVANHGLLPE